MSKKLSRRKRKMSQKKLPTHANNDNFDIAISTQENPSNYLEKEQINDKKESTEEPYTNPHGKDIYNPRQIKMSFILSLVTFSIFFMAIILLYYIDKKYSLIKHLVESL